MDPSLAVDFLGVFFWAVPPDLAGVCKFTADLKGIKKINTHCYTVCNYSMYVHVCMYVCIIINKWCIIKHRSMYVYCMCIVHMYIFHNLPELKAPLPPCNKRLSHHILYNTVLHSESRRLVRRFCCINPVK
jgi:hypothetical protein